jgi:hypothetical protein
MTRAFERLLAAAFCLSLAVSPALAVASDEPSFGDLTHLTFSATGQLRASFVAPLPESAASGSATAVEVSTGLGGGVELRVNGDLIPFTKIGRRVVDTKSGETRFTYYGVPLQPGPNELQATPLGAGGARGTALAERIYGPGRPVHFDVKLDGTLHADGRTVRAVRVAAYDLWNHSALPGSIVRIAIAEGDARFGKVEQARSDVRTPDAPHSEQVLELPLGDDGSVAVPVIPGLRPGTLRIAVTATGDASGEGDFFVRPATREPIVAGLVTAGMGQVPSVPGEDPGAPNGSNSRRGRVALYATGEVARNTLGTLAYDTADVLHSSAVSGPFVADPNERPYSTYGDSSVRRDDALSRDHLYLRLDNDRNSAMWGEFQAQTGGRDGLGGFNLLVAGTKLELAGDRSKLTAFNARNDVAYARQVFAPSGISTLPELLRPEIVVGSETIVLVALDRHTGVVVSQTSLTRNVDYTLDYSTGFLRFINIPLPFDDHFNPQQILVQYEYAGSGNDAQTTGGRYETTLGAGQKTRVGIGYVNDATGAGNFALFGQDVSGVLPGGTWSLGHLSSNGLIAGTSSDALAASGSGDAYRAALTQTRGPNRLALGFDWSSAGFSNPFGGFSTPGLLDYHASFTHSFVRRKGDVTFAFDHEQNQLPGYADTQSTLGVKVREQLTKRLGVTAGVSIQQGPIDQGMVPLAGATPAPAAVVTGTTTQAQVGLDWKVLPNASLALNRTSDIGGSSSASQPGQTSAQFSVDVANKGRFYARELWSDAPTQSFAASTAALTTSALATHSTAFGFERLVGKGTTLDSEYVVEQTGNGSDIYSAMGVKQRFDFNKRLSGDAFVQHATAIGDNLSGFNVYGISATYGEGSRFRGTTSYQLRTGDNPGSTWALGAAGALSPDLSIQATVNNSRTSGTAYDDARVGVAWRPAQNDRGATLLEYERKDGSLDPLATHAEILSLEHVYRPSTRLELAGRYAYKLDGDSYYPAQTSLAALRARQTVGARFDIGGEMSYLDVKHVAGAQQAGVAIESGYRVGDGMRLAVGYNFSGSPDPALATAPTRRGIYLTATSVVDQIFGWGKGYSWGESRSGSSK